MPNPTFPTVDINKAAAEFNQALKEGAQVAVGLGVLGFQRAQVQRVELAKQLEAQLAQLSSLPDTINAQVEDYAQAARARLAELAQTLDERVGPARKQLDEQIDRWEQRLPAGTRSVVQSVRAATNTSEHLLRTAVGLD